ncbi:hypothetical protein DSM110093_01555 [Sulfitobacter sp. DSM 110093]|uniref:DUF6902 family protein n=1 Tax=Sulfitobacter sp. DSM 110093 TaxID=2883127 RepID=UPI001FADD8F3|nr:hypothetical protein [Sulfitobacter sp. DSM 110093]UOA31782.1 hypothetical protein DSM110093_01555 [Sulfitobacter sp. DSM 110093]
MTNVVLLRPEDNCDTTTRRTRLIRAFASERRQQGDVFWMKENAELLGMLASIGAALDAEMLEPLVAFHSKSRNMLRDFPQYYRFILSLCLDLEELGLPELYGAALCDEVARVGLEGMELSDLQRAEARRLLRRRAVGPLVGEGALGERLHNFITRSATFAIPNRKAAYELTHIVYYLSDYGRLDPSLPEKALLSLQFTGLLAFLDQDMDLLAEVCAALRFAGVAPARSWENSVAECHRASRIQADTHAPVQDDYHEWLVTGWAIHIAGRPLRPQHLSDGALRFKCRSRGQGALRPLAECLSDMGAQRSADWGHMRPHVLSYLGPDSHAVLLAAEQSGPHFEKFFEGFARARG